MTSHNGTGNSGGKLKLTGSHCVIMSWPVMTYQNTSQYQQCNGRGKCLQWRVRLVNVEINLGVYLFPDSLICIGCVSVWAGIGSWSQSYSCLDWASLMCPDSVYLWLLISIAFTLQEPGQSRYWITLIEAWKRTPRKSTASVGLRNYILKRENKYPDQQ